MAGETITLTFPNTLTMRAVLRDLAAHCFEDEAPECDDQAEVVNDSGLAPNAVQWLRAKGEAYRTFNDAVVTALDDDDAFAACEVSNG